MGSVGTAGEETEGPVWEAAMAAGREAGGGGLWLTPEGHAVKLVPGAINSAAVDIPCLGSHLQVGEDLEVKPLDGVGLGGGDAPGQHPVMEGPADPGHRGEDVSHGADQDIGLAQLEGPKGEDLHVGDSWGRKPRDS